MTRLMNRRAEAIRSETLRRPRCEAALRYARAQPSVQSPAAGAVADAEGRLRVVASVQ